MVVDFCEKLQSVKDDRRRREIICQCALDSFIAITQEVNSILIILKNEGITPNKFVEYVENDTDRVTPRLLQRLAKTHGGNLLSMSEKLDKDLAGKMQLSEEEISILSKQEREIGADYFVESNPIISQKLDKYMHELMEIDSI